MASSVDPASVVTVGVAFREKCRDNVVIPSDCVCDYDEIAEVASSAELAGNHLAGASSVEEYQERNVLPSVVSGGPRPIRTSRLLS